MPQSAELTASTWSCSATQMHARGGLAIPVCTGASCTFTQQSQSGWTGTSALQDIKPRASTSTLTLWGKIADPLKAAESA